MKRPVIFALSFIVLSAAVPDGYYNDAEGLNGETLKSSLHNIIDGHTEKSYSFLWEALIYTDEDPQNSSNFLLIYTGRSLPKTAEYPQWNREHTWPKSHGDFDKDPPAGTDMHHLRPSDVSVNSDRGNKDFDNGGTAHSEATGCYYDSDSWEPRDEVKGDVARMMFYMEVRYEGDVYGEPDLELVDDTGTSGSTLGKLSTLLSWHKEDPVSDLERTRNDRIYSYQDNRNPFIDHPEYVAYLWEGAIPAPAAVDATDIDSVSFTANWSEVGAAERYRLYVSGNADFTSYLSAYGPAEVSVNYASVTGLQPDKDYYYAVKATAGSEKSEFSDTVHVHTETGEVSVAEIPGFFRIDPAYPNPFNPLCVLPLTLDKSSEMRITLYNVNGEKVTSVFQGRMDSGKHHLRIDGNGLSAGIYILRVDSGTRSQAQKLLLIPERRQSAMNESVI